MIGQSISHYRVSARLGAGGMGEVYRARDTKLNRDVAIKILPAAFAQDDERLARFKREAQVLASLNHPNIAAIHGLEESDGIHALVMELVEGLTLVDRISAGPIPIDDALTIAKQIAEALEYAHERGVIHRDLKPANVKVTQDGTVKVLDFGLAKVFADETQDADLSHSPTLIKGTQAGVILGTAAYMSPEQAQGKTVDKRSDIWSFGVVLYEMLTGKQLFSGETVSDTLASVLRDEVDWKTLPADTPPGIRRLLQRCLDRDRKRRLRDIGEARILLENGIAEPEATTGTTQAAAPRIPLWLVLAGAIAITAVVAALVVRGLGPANQEAPLRKSFILARGLVADRLQRPALSPDGKKIVYMAEGKLWLRELGQYQARELPGTEGPRRPFWSPDSEWVAFGTNDGRLRKVSVRDGSVSVICQTIGSFGIGSGGAWLTDDRIVFSTGSAGLYQVSPQGGEPTTCLEINEETDSDFHEASPLPDGKGVLFPTHRKGGTIDTIELFTDGQRRLVMRMDGEGLEFPVYSATGHILFQRTTGNVGIWALPFSLERLQATGEPFLVAQDGAFPSVSDDGTLLFVRAESTAKQLGWVNRKGEVERPIGAPMQGPEGPALSPDGRSVAVAAFESGSWEIFVLDLVSATKVRLTFTEKKVKLTPSWSPDGLRVFFTQVNPDQLWVVAADGSGKARLLGEGYRPHVSPDSRYLVFQRRGRGGNRGDVFHAPLPNTDAAIEPAAVRTLVEGPAEESPGVVSPDGRYLAYQSDEGGGFRIYIRRFPEGDGKWQVSASGGAFAQWGRDGRELFFCDLSTNTLMVVPVRLGASIGLGSPQVVFSGDQIGAELSDGFDVAPDGKGFVVVLNAVSGSAERSVSIVQNWFAEFKDKQKK